MSIIPREAFVPPDQRSLAYAEVPLKFAPGRYMTEPAIFAKLVQSAEIGPDDKVLLIGAGTGYGAALISYLASDVVALEQDPSLLDAARRNLDNAGIKTIHLRQAVLNEGLPDRAPFDAIIIDGAVEMAPPALTGQLAEGGRLSTILIEKNGASRGMVYRAIGGIVSGVPVYDAKLPVLPGFERPRGFQF
jgi:protein-L-isoaspartate(D-aspartate) O-methyltransferase